MKFAKQALLVTALAFAGSAFAQTPVTNAAINETEVLAAQKAWGDALVAISEANVQGGPTAAKALAEKVLDGAYGYNLGPVLFKPTLTQAPQTFRTTRAGALAYFVGGDANYPTDTGFALKGWKKVEISNAAILLAGNTATTMGNVIFTDKDGKVTVVDKTWEFKKDDAGRLRIVVHHSSLPFAASK
ncbi:hypothetical protein PSQ20_02805 [Curvibacter sp. RS43]|nr:hypothetical protein [Curvibacter sp. RS43]MDD0809253.1 hypothetical protein [Curvibacter sp. RS43]